MPVHDFLDHRNAMSMQSGDNTLFNENYQLVLPLNLEYIMSAEFLYQLGEKIRKIMAADKKIEASLIKRKIL